MASDFQLRDVTEELAVIGLWGPAARDVLAETTDDDVSGDGFPFMQARSMDLDGAPVLAQRVTYVGELGWELYVEPAWAIQVWDRLWRAGGPHGVGRAGYRALDSLRIEKGYRYFGTDLTMLDDPFEAGLGFCVRLDKRLVRRTRGPGHQAWSGTVKRRLRTILIGGEDYVPSTAARRSLPTARSSVDCAAARTGSRSGGTSASRTSRRRSVPETECRSRCSAIAFPPNLSTMRRSTPPAARIAGVGDADGAKHRAGRRAGLALASRRGFGGATSGGLTNQNYLVEAEERSTSCGSPECSTELLAVDRVNERHNAAAAATTGVISPRILEYLPDWSVMVLEYIDGRDDVGGADRGADAWPAAWPRRSAVCMRARGSVRISTCSGSSSDTCGLVRGARVPIPDGFDDRMPTVPDVERAMAVNARATVPCHNDLLAENYIDDGGSSGSSTSSTAATTTRCFELGDTAQECEFDERAEAALCEAYFGSARHGQLARMELYAFMADVGWTLWAAIQAKISTIDYDFWGWAVERWDRATAVMDGPGFDDLCRAAGP